MKQLDADSIKKDKDFDKESRDLIDLMKKEIPADLMEQIEFFARLSKQNQPQLKIWSSSNGTGNAN